ncbi:MAG: hypothetical protein LUD14_13310 [Clostridiales bacterium]|nr:hypothetical protein [Clostridiales bacterium]
MKKYVKPDFEVLDFQMNHTVMETCSEVTMMSDLYCLIGGQTHSASGDDLYFGYYNGDYYAIWNASASETPDQSAQTEYAAYISSILNDNSASSKYNNGMGWHIAKVYYSGTGYYDGKSY